MSFQDFSSMLDDVSQNDEAPLCDARVLGGKALLDVLPDPLQIGMGRLSHQTTDSGLHRM